MTAFKPTTRTRIQIAATDNGWTTSETIGNGPDSVIDVFTRPNAEGNGTQGRAQDTFWRRIARGTIVAHESSRTPKGRVERIIAAFV